MLNGQIFSQYSRPENVPFGNPPLRWVGSADLGADAQTRRSLTRNAGGSALRCSRPQALWGGAGSPKASPATRDGCSLIPVILALTAYDCGRRPAPRFFATPAQVLANQCAFGADAARAPDYKEHPARGPSDHPPSWC